jgi:hypothetical protein
VVEPTDDATLAGYARNGDRDAARSDGELTIIRGTNYGATPYASHTQKIIVKPCAGKLHARFERGCDGNGSASLVPRHHLPMDWPPWDVSQWRPLRGWASQLALQALEVIESKSLWQPDL